MQTQPAIRADQEWFAVQTLPRYEKKVEAELGRKDVEVFLPLYSCERQWSDRRRTIQSPLFPSYLFVRILWTLDSRTRVLRTNGVLQFVGCQISGQPVSEREIESVRTLVEQRVHFEHHPFLTMGQRVRIRGSSLDGIEGVLLAKNSDLSLVVSVSILQRSLAIRVAGYQVEPVESTPVSDHAAVSAFVAGSASLY